MIPSAAVLSEGYNVPPNTDSPVILIIAIAAAVAVSVLLDRMNRKRNKDRFSEEEADKTEAENSEEE